MKKQIQQMRAPIQLASAILSRVNREVKNVCKKQQTRIMRLCNICEREFKARTRFHRFCRHCRYESEVFRFSGWLAG